MQIREKLGTVAHTFKPSIQEAEAVGRSFEFYASLVYRARSGQLESHSEILYQGGKKSQA